MHKPVRSRRARITATAGAVLLGTGALLALQAPLASAQTASTCFGRPVTIVGTNGPDVRTGTLGNDVFSVLGDNDRVRGEPDGVVVGSADYICLGDGNDMADGVAGADYFDGGAGNDSLTGGMGDDNITAGSGNDTIDPVDAGRTSAPSAGADTIDAGEGNDLINEQGDGAIDTIDAGPGLDRCVVDKADNVKNCEQVITPAGS